MGINFLYKLERIAGSQKAYKEFISILFQRATKAKRRKALVGKKFVLKKGDSSRENITNDMDGV
jgi:hypothetical protein